MGTPSSVPGGWVGQEGHRTPPALRGHRRCSPGTMEGAWPREVKGSMCPDSCCSFVICPGSRRRRKEVLGVTAEGPLSPGGARHWHPVPPRPGTPSSPCPTGHSPGAHGSSAGRPQGQTHLCGRDPAVLALHGEALEREGRWISGGPGGDPSLRPPLLGQGGHPEPTGVSSHWQRLAPPGHPMSPRGLWPLTWLAESRMVPKERPGW